MFFLCPTGAPIAAGSGKWVTQGGAGAVERVAFDLPALCAVAGQRLLPTKMLPETEQYQVFFLVFPWFSSVTTYLPAGNISDVYEYGRR